MTNRLVHRNIDKWCIEEVHAMQHVYMKGSRSTNGSNIVGMGGDLTRPRVKEVVQVLGKARK